MEDQNRNNSVVAITTVLAFLASIGLLVYTPSPFKGERPAMPDIPCASEKIRARLWQDPFQAVLEDWKLEQHRPDLAAGTIYLNNSGKSDFRNDIKDFLENNEVTVMGIMVLGEPYGEEAEYRHRWRHAALAGLRQGDYLPEDPDHLEFFKIIQKKDDQEESNYTKLILRGNAPRAPTAADDNLVLENIMPFEWLSQSDAKGAKKYILLLWLNETAFAKSPLQKLNHLQKVFGKQLHVIGPSTSTTLLAMLQEIESEGPETPGPPACKDSNEELIKNGSLNASLDEKKFPLASLSKQLKISSIATVSEDIIEEQGIAKETLNSFFTNKDLFLRTICSDDQLARLVNNELKANRNVKEDDGIILIGEWDTFYGRALSNTFEENLTGKIAYKFHYFRGIDGKLPGESKRQVVKNQQEDSKHNEKDVRKDAKKLEEPVGKSQYDYMRRLAEMISRLENLQKKPIKAIGILGNDFYDKFLILQALKQRFPEKIFFTTDLDARYLLPANIEFTRNLLVASSFDLQLHQDYQKDQPPFRDTYSTAIYASVLYALNMFKPEDFNKLEPRIFEIGRYNAIDLTDKGHLEANLASPPINQALPPKKELPMQQLLSLLPFIIFIIFLFFWLWGWFPENITVNLRPLLLILAGLFLVLVVLFFVLLEGDPREPFSLVEGISIWPTTLIRFFALVLTIVFIVSGELSLQENTREIGKNFCLPCRKPLDSLTNIKDQWQCLKNIILEIPNKIISSGRRLQKAEEKYLSNDIAVANQWQEYLDCEQVGSRWLGILWIVAVYFLVVLLMVMWEPREIPVRGSNSRVFNLIILFMSIFSFLFLTFYVLTITKNFRRFIRHFIKKEPKWEEESLKLFGWNDRLPKEDFNDLILMQLVARRTEAIGRLIFYPFIIWLLLSLAPLRYFDNWTTPKSLLIVKVMGLLLAWFGAFMLRRAAESLKKEVLERLSKRLLKERASEMVETREHHSKADFMEKVINDIKAIRHGAFAPLLEQPIVQALLVPFGGFSTIKLLEILVQFT